MRRRHKKTELSRMTSNAKKLRYLRSSESYEQKQDRLLKERFRKKVKKERASLISSLLNNADNQLLNGIMIPPNMIEVNVQESRSDEEDLKQDKDKISNQSIKDVEDNPKLNDVCESCGGIGSEDKSEGICCLRADVKIEIVLEPLDCQVEGE